MVAKTRKITLITLAAVALVTLCIACVLSVAYPVAKAEAPEFTTLAESEAIVLPEVENGFTTYDWALSDGWIEFDTTSREIGLRLARTSSSGTASRITDTLIHRGYKIEADGYYHHKIMLRDFIIKDDSVSHKATQLINMSGSVGYANIKVYAPDRYGTVSTWSDLDSTHTQATFEDGATINCSEIGSDSATKVVVFDSPSQEIKKLILCRSTGDRVTSPDGYPATSYGIKVDGQSYYRHYLPLRYLSTFGTQDTIVSLSVYHITSGGQSFQYANLRVVDESQAFSNWVPGEGASMLALSEGVSDWKTGDKKLAIDTPLSSINVQLYVSNSASTGRTDSKTLTNGTHITNEVVDYYHYEVDFSSFSGGDADSAMLYVRNRSEYTYGRVYVIDPSATPQIPTEPTIMYGPVTDPSNPSITDVGWGNIYFDEDLGWELLPRTFVDTLADCRFEFDANGDYTWDSAYLCRANGAKDPKTETFAMEKEANGDGTYHYKTPLFGTLTLSDTERRLKGIRGLDGGRKSNFKIVNYATYEAADVINIADLVDGSSASTDFLGEVSGQTYTYSGSATNMSTILKFAVDTKTVAAGGQSFKVSINGNGSANDSVNLWFKGNDDDTGLKRVYFCYSHSGIGRETDSYMINTDETVLSSDTTYEFEMARIRELAGTNAGKDLIYLRINDKLAGRSNYIAYFYVNADEKPLTQRSVYIQSVGVDVKDANYVDSDLPAAPTFSSVKEPDIGTHIPNWGTSNALIEFDSDQASINNFSVTEYQNGEPRRSEQKLVVGELVAARPSNYYHYKVIVSVANLGLRTDNGSTGTETIGQIYFAGANVNIANISVTLAGTSDTITPAWDTWAAESDKSIPTIEKWKNNPFTISFDCDVQNITLNFKAAGGARISDKQALTGTLVEASPANYYHFTLTKDSFASSGAADDVKDAINLANRSGKALHIANFAVTGLPEYENETVTNILSIGDLNGGAAGNIVYPGGTYTHSGFTTTHGSLVMKFNFVANQWAVDGDGFQMTMWDDWPDRGMGGLWLRPDHIRLLYKNDSNAIQYIVGPALPDFAEGKVYAFEYGRLARSLNGVYDGSYYVYVKVDNVLFCEIILTAEQINTYQTAGDRNNINSNKIWIQDKGSSYPNYLRDINFIPDEYEAVKVLNLSDFIDPSCEVIDKWKPFTYTGAKEHGSFEFNFIMKFVSGASIQVYVDDNSHSNKDLIWFRDVAKSQGGRDYNIYFLGSTLPAPSYGLHDVKVTRRYITVGNNAGKHLVTLEIDGEVVGEKLMDVAYKTGNLYMQNSSSSYAAGARMYDKNWFAPMSVSGGVYVNQWKLSASGISFVATVDADSYDMHKTSVAGLIVVPEQNVAGAITVSSTYEGLVKYACKPVAADEGTYTLTANLAGIKDENLNKRYAVVAYATYGDTTVYSPVKVVSFAEVLANVWPSMEAGDAKTALSAKLSKVLSITVTDGGTIIGATGGSWGDTTLTLTGSQASYQGVMLNGKSLAVGDSITVGYYTYTVSTIGANNVTLAKKVHKSYGVSEHFHELNSGQPSYLTVETVSAAMTDLGVNNLRMDINLSDLFWVNAGDKMDVRPDYKHALDSVFAGLPANTEILVVLWYLQPYDGYSYDGGAVKSVPSSKVVDTRSEYYQRYLDLNEQAVRLLLQMYPQISALETWNEPELVGDSDAQFALWNGSSLSKPQLSTFASILTDIMYRVTRAARSVNPDIIVTTPSMCCFNTKDGGRAFGTSPAVLRAFYTAIADKADTNPNNYFQAINIHPYISSGNGVTIDTWSAYVQSFADIATQNGDAGTPVWITEFGYNKKNTSESNAATGIDSIIGKAEGLACVQKFFFFKAIDWHSDISDDLWGLYSWSGTAIVRRADGTVVKNKMEAYN